MSDNKDFVTDAEVTEFINGLNEQDRAELRRQQLVAKAVARQEPKAPDLANMSDAEFIAYKRSLGIG